jgi:hypothetical protein
MSSYRFGPFRTFRVTPNFYSTTGGSYIEMRFKPNSATCKQLIINQTSPQYTTAGSFIEGPNSRSMPEMFHGPTNTNRRAPKRGCRGVRGLARSRGQSSTGTEMLISSSGSPSDRRRAKSEGGPGRHPWRWSARQQRFPSSRCPSGIDASRTPRDSFNTAAPTLRVAQSVKAILVSLGRVGVVISQAQANQER